MPPTTLQAKLWKFARSISS